MNDPGLDAPIVEGAKDVEKQKGDHVAQEDPDGIDDDDEAFLEPSRWWFASTAFPLIAGTFGPMASAFNICALAGKWRVSIAPGESQDNGNQVPDPGWLIGVNAVSLILALVANFALLFNMARRLSFSIAQPITIIGWYLSSFLLIGLVIAAGITPSFQLPSDQNSALTQAFYYAIMASVIYFFIASLMCITVYGAVKGHYPKAFKLTISQRTLMVQTISYLFYLLAGGAVFAHIESWLFLDGVYWANTTLLTIGTGDYSPKTHLGQGLLFPFAIGGIVFLGLVIGSIRSLVLERGKKKMAVRMVEKKREKVIIQLDKQDGYVRVSHLTKGRDLSGKDKPEIQRRKREFEVMRMIQQHASTKRKWYSLTISLMAWFFLWFIGAVIFWVGERYQQGLTYFESLYFAYVSLLTIGYGDYAPVADSSKAFFVFWSLLAVPTLTMLISNMGDTVVKFVKDTTLWVSEFTLLPGETSTKDRLKHLTGRGPAAGASDDGGDPVEEAPGGAGMPEQDRRAGRSKGRRNVGFQRAADALGRDLEEDELNEAEDARQRGDKIDEDQHFYHYLLIKELRKIMKDVGSSKKYSYREWAWFLRLLGEDESDSSNHRQPPLDVTQGNMRANPDDRIGDLGANNNGEGTAPWSWIGERSPLMGDEDESEWLLEKLSRKLEQLLQEEHRAQEKGQDAPAEKLLSPQEPEAGAELQRDESSES